MATPSLHGSLTPAKRKRASVPAKPDSDVEVVEDGHQGQEFLKKTVLYTGAGKTKASDAEAKILTHIKANYAIPADFELDKVKFGQLSGMSYEQRLISAYESGALDTYWRSKAGAGSAAVSESATAGRRRRGSHDSLDDIPASQSTVVAGGTPSRGAHLTPARAVRGHATGAATSAVEVTPGMDVRGGAGAGEAVKGAAKAGSAPAPTRVMMCAECGEEGHWRWDCSSRL